MLLIARGSGLLSLRAMLRHRAANASTVDARLLVSARSLVDVFYRDELKSLAATAGLTVDHTFTRNPPSAWSGIFVCGPTAFGRPIGRRARTAWP